MGSPSYVIQSQLVTEPVASKRRTKACRNYAQGSCRYGDTCAYLHFRADPFPPSPPITSHPPTYYPATYAGPYPASVPITVPLQIRMPPEPAYCYPLFDPRSAPRASPATPASPVLEPNSPVLSSCMAANGPPGLNTSRSATISGKSEDQPRAANRFSSRSSTESGGCYYRTKPCRFYHGSGHCVKGDRCNFYHDLSTATKGIAVKKYQEAVLDAKPKRDDDRSHRRVNHSQAEPQAKRPTKRLSSPQQDADEKPRSNFYPITWRVIGGGVLVGTPREVCSAFMAGHCPDGLDCKFSHPSAANELERDVEITSSPSESYYPHYEQWSPISPLYINPFAMIQMAPPSPLMGDALPVPERKPKDIPIDTYAARPIAQHAVPRVILDGSTLLPRDTMSDKSASDDVLTPPLSRSSSPDPTHLDARSIVRPVSTPPYSLSTFAKVITLFPAEI